jgi:probable O-glycosylation ligase (exosortase A-associated)
MNKQVIFMVLLSLYGIFGSFVISPFVGMAVYICYAVLRPQALWKWSLPEFGWSFYVALGTIAATLVVGPRIQQQDKRHANHVFTRMLIAHLPFWLFAFWIYVTYYTARIQHLGDFHMEEYRKMFIMYLIAILAIRKVSHAWIIVVIYAASLGYISYEINYLYLVNGYLGIVRNGYGGYDNNGAGMLLAMGIPACIYAWEGYRGPYRWIFLAMVPIILHAVLCTYSRGAMLGIIVTVPFWIFRGTKRCRWWKIAALIGLVAMVPILAGDEIQKRFFSVNEYEKDDSANSRFTSWSIAWRIAVENPIFGVGVRNSSALTKEMGADLEGRVIHNQYLQIAADNGIVGMIFYLSIIAFAFYGFETTIRRAKRSTDPDAERAMLAALAAESSLITYLWSAIFLSCEAFEPQYYLLFLGIQLPMIYKGSEQALNPVVFHPTQRWVPPVPRPQSVRPPVRSRVPEQSAKTPPKSADVNEAGQR